MALSEDWVVEAFNLEIHALHRQCFQDYRFVMLFSAISQSWPVAKGSNWGPRLIPWKISPINPEP